MIFLAVLLLICAGIIVPLDLTQFYKNMPVSDFRILFGDMEDTAISKKSLVSAGLRMAYSILLTIGCIIGSIFCIIFAVRKDRDK